MKFRVAKLKDYKALAFIHYMSGQHQQDGFMYQLGYSFLKKYYKILLSEEDSFILLAEDDLNIVHGFVSGTLDASKHIKNMSNHKIVFAFALVSAILRSPHLFGKVLKRYYFVKSKNGHDQFGVVEGARLEYWIWDINSKSNLSVLLLRSWLNIMKEMGVEEIHGEVDSKNIKSQTVHKLMGAIFYNKIALSDGREREFYKYIMNQ
jgi:hypothetical protein